MNQTIALWMFLLLAACWSLSGADFSIAPNKVLIVVASPEHQAVAEELAFHLQLITDTLIPIENNAEEKPDSYVFWVGKSLSLNPPPLAISESRWEITPDGAFFYGEGRFGSRNAAYDFLEAELGVRWINRDGDIGFRKQAQLALHTGSGSWESSYKHFGIRGGGKWNSRQRQGAYYDVPSYGHAFTKLWNEYGESNPEFFALTRQGFRAPILLPGVNPDDIAAFEGANVEAIKVCTSSRSLVEHLIEHWQNKGKSRYVNICENDGNDGFCCCADCQALDVNPEIPPNAVFTVHYTDRYIHMANQVAEAALEHQQDARVVLYAYNEYELPPRQLNVHPAVTIGIVPTVFDLEGTQELIQGWKAGGLTEFFWRPNQHHYFAGIPLFFGYEKHFFELAQSVHAFQPCGFDFDAPGSNVGNELSYYILAKTLQDPQQPFEYWENHFLQAYGDAASEVGQFYRHWRQNWDNRIVPDLKEILVKGKYFNFARGMAWNLKDYFEENDFDITDGFLAAAASKNLSEAEELLVQKLILANQHARLIFRAIAYKKDEDSIALLAFRKKYEFEKFPETERYWGDVTGVFRAEQFREFTPPFLPTELFWRFRLDPQDVGLNEDWQQLSPQELTSWDRMPTNNSWKDPYKHYEFPSQETRELTRNYDGIAWYATTIKIPKDWQRRETFLYFGAVDESCWVYLNGKEIGQHLFQQPNDWTVPFTISLNDHIDWTKAVQQIVVRVEDTGDGGGGIWRPVFVVSKQNLGAERSSVFSDTILVNTSRSQNRRWAAVFTNEVSLQWAWCEHATRAQLGIVGMNATFTTNFIEVTSNYLWRVFSGDTPSTEDVYDLTLTFYGSGSEIVETLTSQLAVVKGVLGKAGVISTHEGTPWPKLTKNAVIPYDAGWMATTATSEKSQLKIVKEGGMTQTSILTDSVGYFGWKVERSDWGYGTFNLGLTFPGMEGAWNGTLIRMPQGTLFKMR